MTDLKQNLKRFLNFNRTERNGIIILLAVLLLVIAFNIFLPFFFPREPADFALIEKEIDEFLEMQQKAKNSKIKVSKKEEGFNQDYHDVSDLSPFPFDPNGLSAEDWKALGLAGHQIRVIKNYEAKGGKFRKKEDLEKIYSISAEEYAVLEPYIQIKGTKEDDDFQEYLSGIEPFPFDPNKMTRQDWESMGLRETLINTLINYTDKGGRFYSNDDFKNIYGLKPEELALLEPFIIQEPDTIKQKIKSAEIQSIFIDLNNADTLDLQQLKGIGPSFARRIVKYRDMLGGFAKKEQLIEVYGMDSTRLAGIVNNIFVDNNSVKKININTATVKDLIRHPYIEFYLAKSIISHREKIGSYSSLEEILDAKLIYRELYEKISPYLAIDDQTNNR
ncbi:MAG: helix-hairpin-helix domain-containing protein [Bacteroidales bacterium]|nr:helix-hairpin-helix domain-containing protein [Bacteroidales bacterium]